MSAIKFNEVRGFSDSITITFNFIRQEFLPLLKSFCILSIPVIFIDLFIKSIFLREVFISSANSGSIIGKSEVDILLGNIGNYLSTLIVIYWIQLQVVSYMRVYWDKCRADTCEKVTVAEVWQVMRKKLGVTLVWGLFYLLIISIGMLFFIVPGVYLALALAFTLYCIIFENASLGDAISDSMEIVKGRWWYLFGYLIVLQLLVSVMAYVFSLPYMFFTLKSVFTGEPVGIYELVSGLLLSSLGQYLLQIIAVVGVAIIFFSIREQQTHSSLLDQIDQMGMKGNDRGAEIDRQNEQEN